MTRSAVLWARAGDAIASRSLWLVIAAFEVVIAALSVFPADAGSPMRNLAAGAVASLALLLVVWLGWAVVLRHLRGLTRVVGAIPVIVLAAMTRGVVLQSLYVLWGVNEPGLDTYRYRLLNSVFVVAVGVGVGVALIVRIRSQRDTLEALLAEQARLDAVLEEAEAEVRAEHGDALAAIRAELETQFALIDTPDPPLAAQSLERFCAEVVRPLSHELAAAVSTAPPPSPITAKPKVSWDRVWGSVADIRTVEPSGPAVVLLLLAGSSSLFMGLPGALLLHGTASALVYIGFCCLRRLASDKQTHGPTPWRLLQKTGLLIVACVPAAVAVAWLPGPSPGLSEVLWVLFIVPLIALLFSLVRAARRQQEHLSREVQALAAQTRWWIARTRMVGWQQRTALARALHGRIQSMIHAAAARLRHAQAADSQALVRTVLADVRKALTDIVLPGEADADVTAELHSMGRTWRLLAQVSSDVTQSAAEWLRADPECAEICVETILEAVSNAVRHGGARTIDIAVRTSGSATIRVEVSDDGLAEPLASRGLGTSQLDVCALQWELQSTRTGRTLWFDLPCLPTNGQETSGTPEKAREAVRAGR